MSYYNISKRKSERLGLWGERISSEYLIKNGYKIVAKRYKNKQGEIDLIAEKDDKIFFFEIKTRSKFDGNEFYKVINNNQIERIYNAAEVFLSESPKEYKSFSVDLLLLSMPDGEIQHIKEIFLN